MERIFKIYEIKNKITDDQTTNTNLISKVGDINNPHTMHSIVAIIRVRDGQIFQVGDIVYNGIGHEHRKISMFLTDEDADDGITIYYEDETISYNGLDHMINISQPVEIDQLHDDVDFSEPVTVPCIYEFEPQKTIDVEFELADGRKRPSSYKITEICIGGVTHKLHDKN
jgi:hypothetical protein